MKGGKCANPKQQMESGKRGPTMSWQKIHQKNLAGHMICYIPIMTWRVNMIRGKFLQRGNLAWRQNLIFVSFKRELCMIACHKGSRNACRLIKGRVFQKHHTPTHKQTFAEAFMFPYASVMHVRHRKEESSVPEVSWWSSLGPTGGGCWKREKKWMKERPRD